MDNDADYQKTRRNEVGHWDEDSHSELRRPLPDASDHEHIMHYVASMGVAALGARYDKQIFHPQKYKHPQTGELMSPSDAILRHKIPNKDVYDYMKGPRDEHELKDHWLSMYDHFSGTMRKYAPRGGYTSVEQAKKVAHGAMMDYVEHFAPDVPREFYERDPGELGPIDRAMYRGMFGAASRSPERSHQEAKDRYYDHEAHKVWDFR